MNTCHPALPLLTRRSFPSARGHASLERGSESSRRPAGSATLDLARRAATESARGNRIDLVTLLFLGASAFAVIAGCAVHLERFVSGWGSFENFVRALLG